MIYLASPYSHSHPLMQEWRYQRIAAVAAEQMKTEIVFCPITHSVPIEKYGGAQPDWRFWARQDLAVLAKCDKLVVARMRGWSQSVGVKAEIEAAEAIGLPVEFTDEIPLDLEI